MSLLFTPLELLKSPTLPIKDQNLTLPLFNHEDYKDPTLEIQHEQKTGDFVLLGPKTFNTFAVVTEQEENKQEADDSSESSSIGVQSSSSEEEDDEEMRNEVHSILKEGALTSLDSLEDSLPIKRGLSNFFTGKSKSFASLCDASAGSAKDLKKEENPFNKRRRILIANKISRSRRASYSSLISPALVLKEGTEEEDERGEDNFSLAPLPKPLSKAFKSPRSFSLSDLQHV